MISLAYFYILALTTLRYMIKKLSLIYTVFLRFIYNLSNQFKHSGDLML